MRHGITAPSLAFALFTHAAAGAPPAEYESFEDGVPPHFAATRPESLGVSPRHSKQGRQSLRWDWTRAEELVIRHGIGDVTRTGGHGCKASFAVWVHMEAPVADALTFEFREGQRVTGSFRFPLEFTGWRQGRPFYHEFPQGNPTAQVDNLRVAAPSRVPRGTVFLDLIKYNTLTFSGRAILPEQEARWQCPAPDARRFPRPERVTEAERAGLRALLGPDQGDGISEAQVNALCARVDRLGIVRDEHGVRGGPGIDRHYQYCGRAGEHGARESVYWPDEHGPGWLGIQTPAPMTDLARRIALAYRAARDPAQRRRLASAFLLLEDHLHDQGMQAGAGFHWNWWVGSAWADAVFLMRDALADAGRLARQRDYLLWNHGGDAIFEDADPPSHMDYYHLNVRPTLRACLVQVDPAEQVRWLRAFQALLERSILQPAGAFKIDGCAYHHGGHYFGYARNAFATLAPLLRDLAATPWRLHPDAHERVRRAMLAQRIYCNQLDLPLSLSGRRPFGSQFYIRDVDRIVPRWFDALARCGSPDGTRAIDPEAAAAWLRLAPAAAQEEPYRTLGLAPEPDPTGTFVMPYAALLSHRRADWLAGVRGQSRYVWGSESEANVNRFGLFQGLGHLEILAGGNPVTAQASGRDGLGWDWRRYEGTTAPQLPFEQMDMRWSRTYSPEPFASGLSHLRQNGIFAMIVRQLMPGDRILQGRKSWFFSDSRILCLGSDISCNETEHPTQTTLCQKRLPRNAEGAFAPTCVDGIDLAQFPAEHVLDPQTPHWFLDVQQTGCLLSPGQNVTLARRHQRNPEYAGAGETEGDFLTAWIDHGRRPAGASYQYLVAIRATPDTMQRLRADPPFKVLQRDRDAHIVWDAAARRWSCALFTARKIAAHAAGDATLPLQAVDRPCLVMADAGRDGSLRVSVADPDLHLEHGVSTAHPLRLTLRGTWRLLDTTATVCAWQLPGAKQNVRVLASENRATTLEIVCQHGASHDLRLGQP